MSKLIFYYAQTPMHPTLARAQFKASFGKFPEEVFREFTSEPFAAASLGQVHRAVTKGGEEVAVKIQYPAIRTTIEHDLKLLRSASLPVRLTGHATEAMIAELERGMLQETDYVNEGRNIDAFREQLKLLNYVCVPRVHWDLSTDRVLCMSFIPGEPLPDFLARNKPSQEVRNRIGIRLLELFHLQLHRMHQIHADPHPGNYLIDSDATIGLVDFGCVKKFSREFIELMRAFEERAWLRGDEHVLLPISTAGPRRRSEGVQKVGPHFPEGHRKVYGRSRKATESTEGLGR